MESFSLELDSSQLPPPHHSSLRSRIDDHYFQSDFPSKTYVPRRCIDDFVTEANIIDELDTKNLSKLPQRKDLIDWIQKKAPRAFLTIIDSEIARTPYELFASMQLLRHCNFEDGCLPWTNTSLFPDDQIERSNQAWIRNTWNRARVKRAFAQAQWKFLVPCISSSTFEYKLQQETILPFSLTDTEPKEGTFARVYPVTIPESHIDPFLQKICTSLTITRIFKVAVKEIKNTSKGVVDAVWYAEVRVLQTIRSLGNPHLIHCLAAIERGSDRYLLFPWAGGGSLREYWDATEHEIPTAMTIRELLSQLKGLASALRELHYFGLESAFERTDPDDTLDNGPKDVAEEYSAGTSIRHGDLKPENLLWFLSDDDEAERCLKIADMGLAKRHAVATQDRSCLTSTRSATVLYEAPETVYTLSNKPRSRQYDIWSMGCITLEWIIWILYGNDQLQKFYGDLKGQDKDPNKWVPYYVINTNGYGPPASLHPEIQSFEVLHHRPRA
ncbi:Sporulation-specific mitogen-activated protein kinase SMK1 [Colletotrichum siamense]|nr:Sporulation-specific mitogen-activated protein kinase SMK1 [Colletotrichum siamense]